jgi:hypothetical protein
LRDLHPLPFLLLPHYSSLDLHGIRAHVLPFLEESEEGKMGNLHRTFIKTEFHAEEKQARGKSGFPIALSRSAPDLHNNKTVIQTSLVSTVLRRATLFSAF